MRVNFIAYESLMKTSFAILIIIGGGTLFVFGGYDDSPGAQGLGLLFVISGIWRLYNRRR